MAKPKDFSNSADKLNEIFSIYVEGFEPMWTMTRQLGCLIAAVVLAASLTAAAPRVNIQRVSFPTNVVEGTTNDRAVKLRASLYLPAQLRPAQSAVVIMPSSGGVEKEREIYYAEQLAEAGIAALVVDSFQSRGIETSIYDQSVIDTWDMENDAIAALEWLVDDGRFDPERIGVLGVSKGGSAAMDTALDVRREWMGIDDDIVFAAHIAISPDCTWINRSARSTGAPIFFMLAERDDQAPAAACEALARRLQDSGNQNIEVKVYKGAQHAWEELGEAPEYDPLAENYQKCRVWVEDDGSMVSADSGEAIPEKRWHRWARRNCMTLGAHCCGGTEALKKEATYDIISFLREHGF